MLCHSSPRTAWAFRLGSALLYERDSLVQLILTPRRDRRRAKRDRVVEREPLSFVDSTVDVFELGRRGLYRKETSDIELPVIVDGIFRQWPRCAKSGLA